MQQTKKRRAVSLPKKGPKLGGTTLVNCDPFAVLSLTINAGRTLHFHAVVQGGFHAVLSGNLAPDDLLSEARLHVLILFIAKIILN